MTLNVGDTLPDASLLKQTADGFETVDLGGLLKGRTVVLFALPGAFTGTCDTLHVPSFVRTAEEFRAKGVDDIVCISVNDPFVMTAWGESTGATAAGILMLADPKAEYTKAVGMSFDAPPAGLYDRSGRYSALVVDGKITQLMVDEPGVCDGTKGEQLLEAMG